jgi:oxygen-independent coproporphyrinogen-3 oxidase
MTSLRTMWGCDLQKIRKDFGEESGARFSVLGSRYIERGEMIVKDNVYYLTDKGKLFADGIAADLFMEPDECSQG